ncbi:MAG: GSCFA domain-containing protein [Bacteroidota bacterium]
MQFHLDFNPGISADKIQHQHSVLLIGSCFTEHIEKKLSAAKFNCDSNPFGIVFNPKSIAIGLIRIIEKNYFTENDLMNTGESWISLETHTALSKSSKEELLSTLNNLIDQWHLHLSKSNWLILTFGSAHYYQYNQTGSTVANCHKLPGQAFTKKTDDPTQIETTYTLLLKKLHQLNPSLKVLFTVSPVKHLRDGVIQNNLSKAILTVSIHTIIRQNKNCFYFPAYELVNDDLRDYRFYEPDMAHPNKQAIEYVWNKFADTYFDKETLTMVDKFNELHSSMNHRPLHIHTKAFTDFKAAQLKKCLQLQKLYPYVNLENEISYFSKP